MASNTIAHSQINNMIKGLDHFCDYNVKNESHLAFLSTNVKPQLSNISRFLDLKESNPKANFLNNIKETDATLHEQLSGMVNEYKDAIAKGNNSDSIFLSDGQKLEPYELQTREDDEIVLHLMLKKHIGNLDMASHQGLNMDHIFNSAQGADAVRELKEVAPPEHLQELNKILVDKGYKFLRVSGEGDHCGLRSVTIAMLNHYRHLDPAGREQFLQNMDQSLENAEDKAQLKAMFEAAGDSLDNVLQTETNSQTHSPAVRIRLPNEAPGFKSEERGQNGGLETKAEALVSKLIVAFSQELAQADPADNEKVSQRKSLEANDLADSVTSSTQMSSDIIPKLLNKLGITHALVVDNNSHCWSNADRPDQQLHSSQDQFNQLTDQAMTEGQSIIEHKANHFNIYVQ